jgi:hypothetical protein
MSKSKNKLSAVEQRDYTRLEKIARDCIQEAQSELVAVEKLGLWRSTHKTFGEYCTERFGFDPTQLNVESMIEILGGR